MSGPKRLAVLALTLVLVAVAEARLGKNGYRILRRFRDGNLAKFCYKARWQLSGWSLHLNFSDPVTRMEFPNNDASVSYSSPDKKWYTIGDPARNLGFKQKICIRFRAYTSNRWNMLEQVSLAHADLHTWGYSDSGFKGQACLTPPADLRGWEVRMEFYPAMTSLRVQGADVYRMRKKGRVFFIRNQSNTVFPEGSPMCYDFETTMPKDMRPSVRFQFVDVSKYSTSGSPSTPTGQAPTTSSGSGTTSGFNFTTTSSWSTGLSGSFCIVSPVEQSGWTIELTFDESISNFQVWDAVVQDTTATPAGTVVTMTHKSYNRDRPANSVLCMDVLMDTPRQISPTVTGRFLGVSGTGSPGNTGTTPAGSAAPTPTANQGGSTASVTGNPAGSNYKVVCYFTNWAQYRTGAARFTADDINPFLCSHIMYAFGRIDGNNIATVEWNDADTYQKVMDLKQVNPSLHILLAVGGATAGPQPFSAIVASPNNIAAFATNAVSFLRQYGFDGLDLDWEFPASHGTPASDKEGFITLLETLMNAFENEAAQTGNQRLLLTAAVAAGSYYGDPAYDKARMHPYLDFISIMAYDYYGPWSSAIGHNSPLYGSSSTDVLSQDWSVDYWSAGVPLDKLVLGLATYGRTFTLPPGGATTPGSPFSSSGPAGPFTAEAGFVSYYEVCQWEQQNSMTRRWLNVSKVPYSFGTINNARVWIGYDNVDSMRAKTEYIRSRGLAGAMFWALDLDDFGGSFCGEGKYPLISTVSQALSASSGSTSPPGSGTTSGSGGNSGNPTPITPTGPVNNGILALYSRNQTGEGTYYGETQEGLCSYKPPEIPSWVTGDSRFRHLVALNFQDMQGSYGCGMCFRVQGSGVGLGASPIIGDFYVFVHDLCPTCPGLGDLDLAANGDGRWDIHVEAVQCPVDNVKIEFKFQGSNPWYLKLQIRNARIPVTTLEVYHNGGWQAMSHTTDNFYEYSNGQMDFTNGLRVRMTAANGQQLEDVIPRLENDKAIPGNIGVQFSRDPSLPFMP